MVNSEPAEEEKSVEWRHRIVFRKTAFHRISFSPLSSHSPVKIISGILVGVFGVCKLGATKEEDCPCCCCCCNCCPRSRPLLIVEDCCEPIIGFISNDFMLESSSPLDPPPPPPPVALELSPPPPPGPVVPPPPPPPPPWDCCDGCWFIVVISADAAKLVNDPSSNYLEEDTEDQLVPPQIFTVAMLLFTCANACASWLVMKSGLSTCNWAKYKGSVFQSLF